MYSSFKEKLSFQKRKEVCAAITAKHSTRIPVIVDRAVDSPNLPVLGKQKYLTPQHFTMANFTNEVLNHLPVHEQTHICFYVGNGTRVMPAKLMLQVYDEYKDQDGFLYVTYGEHKAFGAL